MTKPIVPIIPQVGKRSLWFLDELYVGPHGTPFQVMVPNVGDMVIDVTRGTFLVTHVDETNFYAFTLAPWNPAPSDAGISDEDLLLGSGPGYDSESFRLFVNDKTLPFSARLDGRLYIRARKAASIVIFKGTDTTSNGNRISAVFDQWGDLITNHIPLVDRPTPSGQETSIKVTDPFVVTTKLDDGDIVTAVVYGMDGEPLSVAKMKVLNSENIMHGSTATKYIESIYLESPFLSTVDEGLIEFPINVLAQSAMFMGVVRYNDGSHVTYPVDGGKFTLDGINSYIPSRVGQNVRAALVYNLSPEENSSLVSDAGGKRFITKEYRLVTTESKDAFSVGMYAFPNWNVDTNEYEMRYYLNSLQRDSMWDVTEHVRLHTMNRTPFDGKLYGLEQELLLTVDLGEVDGMFSHFRHVQPVWVTLLREGNELGQKWRVRYAEGGEPYGDNQIVKSKLDGESGKFSYDLTCGWTTFDDWLLNVLYKTQPIRHATYEQVAPQPTQFTVVIGNERIKRDIHQYVQPLLSDTNLFQGTDIFIEFERSTSTGILQIGVAGIPVDRS